MTIFDAHKRIDRYFAELPCLTWLGERAKLLRVLQDLDAEPDEVLVEAARYAGSRKRLGIRFDSSRGMELVYSPRPDALKELRRWLWNRRRAKWLRRWPAEVIEWGQPRMLQERHYSGV